MKCLLTLCLAATLFVCSNVDSANAQGGSYSYSSRQSQRWGSSWGYGPSGYYSNGYSQRSGQQTVAGTQYGYNPYYGGYVTGNRRTTGYNQVSGYNNGWGMYGPYSNNYANFNRYNNQRRWVRLFG